MPKPPLDQLAPKAVLVPEDAAASSWCLRASFPRHAAARAGAGRSCRWSAASAGREDAGMKRMSYRVTGRGAGASDFAPAVRLAQECGRRRLGSKRRRRVALAEAMGHGRRADVVRCRLRMGPAEARERLDAVRARRRGSISENRISSGGLNRWKISRASIPKSRISSLGSTFDITTLLRTRSPCGMTVDRFAWMFSTHPPIDKVVGIESRGFMFALPGLQPQRRFRPGEEARQASGEDLRSPTSSSTAPTGWSPCGRDRRAASAC